MTMAHSGFFDGAAKPNPGEVGMGASITNAQQQEIDWAYTYKPHGTNNEAEYLSAILLLRQALHNGITEIDCYGDSQLVIKQINGEWAVSKESLIPLNKRVVELANKFKRISFTWIPRAKNSRADELSCIAIEKQDSGRKIPVKDVSIKEPATVSNIQSLKAETKTTVRDLKNGNYLIVEPTGTSIVNTHTMSCSCGAFLHNKQCKHTITLFECRKQA